MKPLISRRVLCLLALLFPVVAFAQTTGPRIPRTAPGLDGRFVELARQVPGFGGYFFDANGDLNVYLTDLLREPAARAAVADVARNRGERSQQPWSRPAEIVVRRGDFDFLQLDAWRARLAAAPVIEGVHFLDTDEAINRIFIGVTEPDAVGQVLVQLDVLGIPRNAVVVDLVPAGSLIQSLRDHVRPLVGGLEIRRGVPNCTLGVNVWYGNIAEGVPVGTAGFYTASHCSTTYGGTDGTIWTQGGAQIGFERWDPPFFTNADNAGCPVDRRCRNSDVAFVQYDAGVDRHQGALAQTLWRGFGTGQPGSLDISPGSPVFNIPYTTLPVQGMYLDKVGRTTGWTSGAVQNTCIDQHVDFTDITILCQDRVNAFSAEGDSGSPVFEWINYNTAAFSGIVWYATFDGASYLFSNLNRIAADMGFGVGYGPN